jgi:hypothetical protein
MAFTFKDYNAQQKAIRAALKYREEFEAAINLVLQQHAWAHQGVVSGAEVSTFADQLWGGLDEDTFRKIPPGGEHSIAWCLYHLARIEDTILSVAMAEVPMLLDEDVWAGRLNVPYRDTGNEMPAADIQILSQQIDMAALKAYRAAVGVRTREFIRALTVDRLKVKVTPAHIQKIVDLEAVRVEAKGLLEFWSKRTMEGLLLMPATRHNMVHINEALRLKERLMRRKK